LAAEPRSDSNLAAHAKREARGYPICGRGSHDDLGPV